MEKYSKFSDKTTGKLGFNQPIPLYTTLPLIVKILYWIYIYSIYPALIVLRLPLIKVLTLIWVYVPIPFKDSIFTNLLLLCYGCIPSKPMQASTLQKKKCAVYKLTKNTIICGQLTSPVDILLYIKYFKPSKVLFPSFKVLSPASAFNNSLNFESFLQIEESETKTDFCLPNKRVLVFPEQFPTNQTVVMRSYLSSELFVNRQIICASSKKIWSFVPKQHSSFDFLTNCDDVGSLIYRQTLFCNSFKASDEVESDKVQKGLASCLGVECGSQGISERKAYMEAYAREQE
ncbi:Conserved_hypothetical protein [Hexamita inflata]|uniref:Uncharacterized protein n=1 Tax=Hexamita inflata TaxID=28002 RepID=A0AA86QLS4_9EUKA|nr:Conserved hypothetical protein [Hexamita inflata]